MMLRWIWLRDNSDRLLPRNTVDWTPDMYYESMEEQISRYRASKIKLRKIRDDMTIKEVHSLTLLSRD